MAYSIVSALVYSGRPDPEWTLASAQWSRLEATLAELPRHGPAPLSAPPLGYRGVVVRRGPEQWWVYGGAVHISGERGLEERRFDPERLFEKALLESAPPGSLPPHLLGS